jgi:hypothetical protein
MIELEGVNAEQVIEFGLRCLKQEQTQRPFISGCKDCSHFIVDNKQRKFKYGCERICKDAIKTLVDCGFKDYELLMSLAGKFEKAEVTK